MKHEMREELAALAHQRWARWMTHLFENATHNADGTLTVARDHIERWQRQVAASYDELSEIEKDSDRIEADRILEIITRRK